MEHITAVELERDDSKDACWKSCLRSVSSAKENLKQQISAGDIKLADGAIIFSAFGNRALLAQLDEIETYLFCLLKCADKPERVVDGLI